MAGVRRPNFPLAFILAIAAGGAAAFVISLLMIPFMGNESEKSFDGAATAAALIATYATVICFVYTILLGIGVVIYVRNTRRVPSLSTALVAGLLAGGIPFVAMPLFQYLQHGSPSKFDIVLLPILAIGSAIATAWMFWAVGLRGRTVAD